MVEISRGVKKYLANIGGAMGKAKERIQNVLGIVSTDNNAMDLIQETLTKGVKYVEAVYNMETQLSIYRFRMEGEEYRSVAERLDSLRKIAHDAFIDSIMICNRYLFRNFGELIPAGGIYSDDPMHLSNNDRMAIGDWAFGLVKDYFIERRV
jgi:hypothetical protein